MVLKYTKREITSILFLEKTIEKTKKEISPFAFKSQRKAVEKI